MVDLRVTAIKITCSETVQGRKPTPHVMKRLLFALLLGGLTVPAATAQWGNGMQNNWDSRQAGNAVRDGKIKSLSEIYAGLRGRFGGKALDARLMNGDTYQIRWETGDGRVLDLTVNARTGAIMSQRGAR